MESPTAYLREPEDARGRHGATDQDMPPGEIVEPSGGPIDPQDYSEPTYTPSGSQSESR